MNNELERMCKEVPNMRYSPDASRHRGIP